MTHLFSPLRIGRLRVSNRILMAPMTRSLTARLAIAAVVGGLPLVNRTQPLTYRTPVHEAAR